MIEKKTPLPSLRNQNWKYAKEETKRINHLLPNISTDNVNELNELIHAETKQACYKIGLPLRNPNRNTKPALEIRIVKKLWQ